jgi:predicted membrane protein
MRMQFLFGGLFWGILLVLFGATIIIKAVFKIDIPFFRIVGAKILFGGVGIKADRNTIMFSDTKVEYLAPGSEYNVIFGRSTIDLSDIDVSGGKEKIEISVIFGSGLIYINQEIPMKIKISTVFGDTKMPVGNVSFFGDYIYKTGSYTEGEDYLRLDVDVVFGSVIIEEK